MNVLLWLPLAWAGCGLVFLVVCWDSRHMASSFAPPDEADGLLALILDDTCQQPVQCRQLVQSEPGCIGWDCGCTWFRHGQVVNQPCDLHNPRLPFARWAREMTP